MHNCHNSICRLSTQNIYWIKNIWLFDHKLNFYLSCRHYQYIQTLNSINYFIYNLSKQENYYFKINNYYQSHSFGCINWRDHFNRNYSWNLALSYHSFGFSDYYYCNFCCWIGFHIITKIMVHQY